MCGRYSLALRPSQIRRMLQNQDMPVWDAPEDDADDAPRQSYNFAPGYHGVVYRADVPDHGAGPRRERSSKAPGSSQEQEQEEPEDTTTAGYAPPKEVHYKLQSMKWGLIPFWTKRNPDYANLLKTINCRDDSLSTSGGMWTTMKARKRCVVVAQGFYEWLKVGKERVPHYIRRKDGLLLCMAGLWDCVAYEDDQGTKNYTYTIITTDSNAQLKFLHDRMPVVLESGSEKMRMWLDPGRYEWSKELQGILKPWDGELEIDAVSKEVNKVGNNSPSFIIPVASKENKSNIANFFANAKSPKKKPGDAKRSKLEPEVEVKKETAGSEATKTEVKTLEEATKDADDGRISASQKSTSGIKREAEDDAGGSPMKKAAKKIPSKGPPAKSTSIKGQKISATSNGTKSPSKGKSDGSQKITKFFANSA